MPLPRTSLTASIRAAAMVLTLGAVCAPMAPLAASAEQSPSADPRAGDPSFERSRRLFGAIRDILDEAAQRRLRQQTQPDGAVEEFFWRQMGLDSQGRVRDLLSSAFEMMTDAPVVRMQADIARRRGQIGTLRERIAELKEQRISAPEDGGVSSWVGLSDDRDSLTSAIANLEKRIEGQEQAIAATKQTFADAMAEAGTPLSAEQSEMLLESVTGEDLVALAAAYEAVRGVSDQLKRLMDDSGEDLTFAKRYYGMHTALIALLVEAQNRFLGQIDAQYLPKLAAIEQDIASAAADTERLLADDPTREQVRALAANQKSQKIAKDALDLYRDYLMRQRGQIQEARDRTLKELRVADNTLRTVDASFQLREVMESAATSFDALRSLQSPGIERLFQNEQLRREFKELTEKLAPGS